MSFLTPRPDGEPVVLRGEHRVTVTKEERHQPVLARHVSTDGRARQIAAELGFCRIAEGKHRGGRAVEVRIGAERVGELTARMSERYAPLVEAVLATGRRPVCEAVVVGGSRGVQVELRLPPPDALPTSPPPPPRISSAAWTTTPSAGPEERSLPTPPHGKLGVAARHIQGEAAVGSHREPAARLPAQRKNRKRKAVLWGVGAFLGLGFLGSLGDDEPARPAAARAAVSPVTATTSAQPTPTTSSAAATTTPARTTTGAVGAGAGAGAGVNVPDRPRTTTRSVPTTTTAPTRTREQPASVYYKNCAAVRAAGAAPIRRGDPGYASHLDRDGDGEGCAGD